MKVIFFVLRDKKPLFCCCVNAHGNIGKTARKKKKPTTPQPVDTNININGKNNTHLRLTCADFMILMAVRAGKGFYFSAAPWALQQQRGAE